MAIFSEPLQNNNEMLKFIIDEGYAETHIDTWFRENGFTENDIMLKSIGYFNSHLTVELKIINAFIYSCSANISKLKNIPPINLQDLDISIANPFPIKFKIKTFFSEKSQEHSEDFVNF